MRFGCRIGWHRWGKWRAADVRWRTYVMGYQVADRVEPGHARECEACGKEQVR